MLSKVYWVLVQSNLIAGGNKMSSKLKTKLTILLLSFVLVLGISCQKKTLAIENHSNSSPKQDGYEAPVANQSDETEKNSDFSAST